MTEDTTVNSATQQRDQLEDAPGSANGTDLTGAATTLQAQPMIPIDRLKPDPENVRADLDLNPQFLASIAAVGVLQPLRIRLDADDPGMCVVVEGHRRYYAAVEAGLTEVPYSLKDGDDRAAKFLEMYLANNPAQRRNHDTWEQLEALHLARKAGASRTTIREVTGLSAGQVKTALKAGRISTETRAAAIAADYEWTLDEQALLAEFDGDEDAIRRLMDATRWGSPLEHEAQRIRDDRAERAEHDRLRGELEAAGIPVTDSLPEHAALLEDLLRDGQELTADAHADCPGRGVFFRRFEPAVPVHYCDDPQAGGHEYRLPEMAERAALRAELVEAGVTVSVGMPAGAAAVESLQHEGADLTADSHTSCPGHAAVVRPYGPVKPVYYCQTPEVYGHTSRPLAALESVTSRPAPSGGPPRSVIVEGNKAWVAAGRVRRRWLSSLMARRTAPKQTAGFLAGQLLRMPRPLAECLPRATGLTIFTELTGRQREAVLAEGETAANGRLLLLALSPILTSYEHEMVGDGDRKATWRTDRANPYCSRSEAGDYLRYLISVGYEAAPIEKAVADGVPYTGDVDPGQGPMDGDQPDSAAETANTETANTETANTETANTETANTEDANTEDATDAA